MSCYAVTATAVQHALAMALFFLMPEGDKMITVILKSMASVLGPDCQDIYVRRRAVFPSFHFTAISVSTFSPTVPN